MTRRVLIPAATLVAVLLAAAPAHAGWIWPVRGEVITRYRNGADPYAAGQHRGIDIAAAPGAAVVAAAGGAVRFAGTAGSSGLTVSIRTGDGRYDTSYLHLSAASVREGQRVEAGERVGAVGTTGARSAAQAHLHFGVREAGRKHAYHDPLGFLPPVPTAPRQPRPAPGPSPVPVPLSPAPEPLTPAPEPVTPAPEPVTPAPEPVGEPPLGRAPGRVPAPRGAPVRAPLPLGSPEHEPARGPEIGWVLACLGLLAAAALLGLSEDGRSATRKATRGATRTATGRWRQRATALVSLRMGGR